MKAELKMKIEEAKAKAARTGKIWAVLSMPDYVYPEEIEIWIQEWDHGMYWSPGCQDIEFVSRQPDLPLEDETDLGPAWTNIIRVGADERA